MEVVDELDLFDVLEDEVAHGLCLWLRERERSGESIRARVLLRTLVSMREAVVAVEVHSGVCVVAAEPLATPAIVSILAFHDKLTCTKC